MEAEVEAQVLPEEAVVAAVAAAVDAAEAAPLRTLHLLEDPRGSRECKTLGQTKEDNRVGVVLWAETVELLLELSENEVHPPLFHVNMYSSTVPETL